jgi:hypothetical protein
MCRMDRMDRMGVEDRMDPNGERMDRVDRAGVDLDGDVLRDLGDPIHLTMGGILYIHIYIFIFTRYTSRIVCIYVAIFCSTLA